jgi:cytochrome c biogenesis protein CcmG/thiol:disulfide interchange protein DsbE
VALVTLIGLAIIFLMRPQGPLVIGAHPLLGATAPDFTLEDLDGRTVALADYRGRPVIVNFWASWCVPCREEFPLLKAARERYAAEGLEVLGIVFDDDADPARRFMDRAGAAWPALVDPGGVIATDYKVNVPPLSFFIDGEGVIRSIAYGPPPSGSLDDRIAELVSGDASSRPSPLSDPPGTPPSPNTP